MFNLDKTSKLAKDSAEGLNNVIMMYVNNKIIDTLVDNKKIENLLQSRDLLRDLVSEKYIIMVNIKASLMDLLNNPDEVDTDGEDIFVLEEYVQSMTQLYLLRFLKINCYDELLSNNIISDDMLSFMQCI